MLIHTISQYSKDSCSIMTDSSVSQRNVELHIRPLEHSGSAIERYSTILDKVLEGLPLGEILNSLVLLIEAQKLGTRASILLLSDDGKRLLSGAAPNLPDEYNKAIHGVEIGPHVGSCGASAYCMHRIIVEDIANHPNWAAYKELPLKAGLRACWSEPIIDSNKKVLGTFAMYYDTVKTPKEQDLVLINEAARLASLAIERSRSMHIQSLNSKIFNSLPISLAIINEQGSVLDCNPAFNSLTDCYNAQANTFDVEHFLSQVNPKTVQEIFERLSRGHSWQGELVALKSHNETIDIDLTITVIRDSLTLQNCFAWLISDISAKKSADKLINYQKNNDQLTGLPNRQHLINEIDSLINQQQSRQSANGFSLLMMDLDHFKQVNDTLGHENGDALLQKAALRITKHIPEGSILARMGADEFALLLPEKAAIEVVSELANKLNTVISHAINVADERLIMSMSIGIAQFPGDAKDTNSLIKFASQAMFNAKKHGRNGYCFFDNSLQHKAQRTATLTQHLKNAIANNEFELYYQPMVSPVTGKVNKAEVLLRWQRDGEFISPEEFIPIAEETNLIVPIGEWVREQTIKTAFELQALGVNIPLSVNVSPLEFWSTELQKRFIDFFDKALGKSEHGTCHLPLMTLEITESLMMKHQHNFTELLTKLRKIGLKIAVDDFGTGYSSLAYLVNFPVDQIKIDKSFIQKLSEGVKHQSLVNAIINMSLSLGLSVVVEGVETEAEFNFIKQHDITAVQGYYFFKPMPKGEFVALLHS